MKIILIFFLFFIYFIGTKNFGILLNDMKFPYLNIECNSDNVEGTEVQKSYISDTCYKGLKVDNDFCIEKVII